MTTYLVYTDDSGNQSVSLHTGILVPVEAWQGCLEKWKKYRRALYRTHRVLTDFEIHAQEWIAGTGVPSADPVVDKQGRSINDTKGLRYEWARKALQTIAAMDGLQIHTDVVSTSNKRAAYRSYIKSLDRELAARGDFGIVVMDGDPKNPDPSTRQEHRDLPLRTRAIIEDGWVQDSSMSQFIQIADRRTAPSSTSSAMRTGPSCGSGTPSIYTARSGNAPVGRAERTDQQSCTTQNGPSADALGPFQVIQQDRLRFS